SSGGKHCPRSLRPTQTKLAQRAVSCHRSNAGGFGGDQGFEIQDIEQQRFCQLHLQDIAFHPENRFGGKHNFPFPWGVDISGKFKIFKKLEIILPESLFSQKTEVFICERQCFERFENIIQTGKDDISSPEGDFSEKIVKTGGNAMKSIGKIG